MLPGMELMGCTDLAVPGEVMHHVVRVESSYNPYAIGVVGGRLARQPKTLPEAVATMRMLEREDYNYSVGLAQVNRHNLVGQGLDSPETAFDICPNLRAGARILAECYGRAGRDWGKAFSCYYSGNFETGFRHGYVQKVFASWQGRAGTGARVHTGIASSTPALTLVERRIRDAMSEPHAPPQTQGDAPMAAATSREGARATAASLPEQAVSGRSMPSQSPASPDDGGAVRVQLMSATGAPPPVVPAPADDGRDAAFVF